MKNQPTPLLKREVIKTSPVIVGIATGLYPLLYNYYTNFTLVDSVSQFLFFIAFFLLLPVAINVFLKFLSKKVAFISKNYLLLLSISNIVGFAALITFSLIGPKKKLILLVIILTVGLAFLLKNHLKKVIILEYILALIVAIQLGLYVGNNINFSSEWTRLPDTISETNFKKKPNVYIIQPDGYANSNALKKKPYNINNSEFEYFLTENNFKIYPNFRSNYTNTIASNSSMFAMKHHFYKKPKPNTNEPYGLRKSIASNNAVVSIFNKNDYRTSLIIESPYVIINRPTLGYDYCSISYKELSFLSRGFDMAVNSLNEMEKIMEENKNQANFYFIEKIIPGHIAVTKTQSKGKEEERKMYIEDLEKANVWMREMIALITKKDPSALIVIVADHGGFVGLNYTGERYKKITDPKLINSIFAATLAIRWPNNEIPEFDNELKTNVNLFRILFSYLAENDIYLNSIEKDESFLIVGEDAPFGVYKVIDGNGKFVFKNLSL
ncbi:hypothetical protein [Aequorivita sp. CIP111184]|uniref:hypothetical protein n=1 Tax=Aequorivita sp. CIP111184 TaxID=2211356 RepID=UPI000DBC040C|nr:hypothetical protein [Aequorivita sp. CIP111184]SRX54944.1 hypothetical protein AEQU1_01964 [Aequorivita sp. CIP111184]